MVERGTVVTVVSGFACAAGAMGILANVLLFVVRASHPEVGASLGPAFMVPGVLLMSAWLPDRRLCLIRPVGAGTLSGGVVVGLGFLLRWMSWLRLLVFGAGGVLGVIGIPVWFLLVGRHLAS